MSATDRDWFTEWSPTDVAAHPQLTAARKANVVQFLIAISYAQKNSLGQNDWRLRRLGGCADDTLEIRVRTNIIGSHFGRYRGLPVAGGHDSIVVDEQGDRRSQSRKFFPRSSVRVRDQDLLVDLPRPRSRIVKGVVVHPRDS